MRCSESERSEAILGRPTVRNPLDRLPRKLTPVRTIMMSTMLPLSKLPPSTSTGICDKPPETDFVFFRALELAITGRDTAREFRGGVGKSSLLVASNSMAGKYSDIVILRKSRSAISVIRLRNVNGGLQSLRLFRQ